MAAIVGLWVLASLCGVVEMDFIRSWKAMHKMSVSSTSMFG